MKQQEVQIIGFRANGYKAIEAVVLQPDLLKEKLVRIVGEIGNGKSSLMELMQIALSGSDAVAKKDALKTGFIAEVQISDGDHKLFMGAKVTEFVKGENKGMPKFETFLYEKDIDGKPFVPVIDGRKATASDYMEMLHTEITFNMPLLFSNNQTEHRKLIEGLFSQELKSLGIEAVVARIEDAKKRQDNTRAICEANGAFRSTFEDEGYKVEELEQLQPVNLESIRQQITEKEIEKDRILRQSDDAKALFEEKARSERDGVLRGIQDKVQAITEEIRVRNDKFEMQYKAQKGAWLANESIKQAYVNAKEQLLDWPVSDNAKSDIFIIIDKDQKESVLPLVEPLQPETIVILNNVPQVQGTVAGYEDLIEKRQSLLTEYRTKQSEPMPTFVAQSIDTTEIDSVIGNLKVRRDSAEKVNNLVNRFRYWQTWIEAKGLYEKEIDTLRKLYGKVNTGVAGMVIDPMTTNTGRIEIWLKYNGTYDSDFFGNAETEQRFLFEYSAFQQSIIGLLLQAARLDLKPKALRMAFIDDISVTKKSIEMLNRVCDQHNLKLWTTYAKDDYDLNNIPDGEIIVEGGHIFFSNNQ